MLPVQSALHAHPPVRAPARAAVQELFERDPNAIEYGKSSPIPPDVMCELVAGVIERCGGAVSSRVLGRQLQMVQVGDRNLLNILKASGLPMQPVLARVLASIVSRQWRLWQPSTLAVRTCSLQGRFARLLHA
jgi:hypothetical protein